VRESTFRPHDLSFYTSSPASSTTSSLDLARMASAVSASPSSASLAVERVTAALCDAVTAVDHLKCAAMMLKAMGGQMREVGCGGEEKRRGDRLDFEAAAEEVKAAVHWAPVLGRRAELMRCFGVEKGRVLVTTESVRAMGVVVHNAEKWLKEIVRDIGRDLVIARREAKRVGVVDSYC
jgi:hypothetical protein